VISAVRNFSLGLLQAKQVNCIPFRHDGSLLVQATLPAAEPPNTMQWEHSNLSRMRPYWKAPLHHGCDEAAENSCDV